MRWLIVLVLLPGCVEDRATHSITGSFTAGRANSDLDAVIDFVRQRGGDVAIMESYPEQFHASGLSAGACNEVQQWLAQQSFIQSHSDCKEAV